MEFKTGKLTENQRKRPFDKVRKLRKTADQNLKVYFYVTAHTDGSKVYHYDEEYNTPIKTFARPGYPPLKTKFKYVVNDVFHSDYLEESITIKGFHVDRYDLVVPVAFGCIQMTGYIPQGSYYYEDEYGQIVTDTLVCLEPTHSIKYLTQSEPIDSLHTYNFSYKTFTEKLNKIRKNYFTTGVNFEPATNNAIRKTLEKDMKDAYFAFKDGLPSLLTINDVKKLHDDARKDVINIVNEKPMVFTDEEIIGKWQWDEMWRPETPEEIEDAKAKTFWGKLKRFFAKK